MSAQEKTAGGLSRRNLWAYPVGTVGRDMAGCMFTNYLLTYVLFTKTLTSVQFACISVIMVAARVFDAFNDPIMGNVVEATRTRWGKFKPWIAIGGVLSVIVFITSFSTTLQGWAYVAAFGLLYFAYSVVFTMNDIAYWGMLPSLSSDPKERDTLVTLMSVFICVGQFAVAGIVPTVVAGNAIQAYRVTALIVALAFIAFQTLVVLGVREAPRRDDAEKVTLRKMFTIFMRNDQLVPIGIASLLFNIGNGLLIIFGVNFFYFEFGYADSGDLIFLFTVMYGLGTLFSQALYAFISSRMHRMTILKICMAAIAVGYGMLMGFGYVLPKNVVLLNAIGFIIFFFQGLYNLAVIVMLNNTIEYDELRFGERHDSVISAIRSFSVKLAGAVNQGISALVLIISGIYTVSQNISGLEIEVGKGGMTSAQALEKANAFTAQVQPRQTLLLRIGMVVIPVLALTCAYVLIRKKYKITEEAYQKMVAEIAAR